MTEKHCAHLASRLLLATAFAFTSMSNPHLCAQNAIAPVPLGTSVSASQKPTSFDVATIKPASVRSDGVRFISLNVSPDGMVSVTNWNLKNLICAAYNLNWSWVQGGPAWIEKDLYDVTAKPAPPANGISSYNIHHDNWQIDDPQLRAMLQALLQDRFALKTHVATKDGAVYILEKSDGELALTPSKHPSRGGGLGGVTLGTVDGRVLLNTSMASLVGYLSAYVFHQPVIDKTGLGGTYDFITKNIASEEEAFPPGGTPNVTLLVRYVKEMGLKLTKSTGPVTTLVIDQASQPSPN
jgi:uncharacterized protein (TIGR03435 family)